MTDLDDIGTTLAALEAPPPHELTTASGESPQPPAPLSSSAGPRIALSTLERVAAKGLTASDDEAAVPILREVLAWAVALDDAATREVARLRFVAKALAACRAKCLVLEQYRDHHLLAGHLAEVRVTQRALDSETRRLALLLAEHRLACAADKRSVTVAVGRAGTVNIAAGLGVR